MKWLLLACMLAVPAAAMAQSAQSAASPDSLARARRSDAAPVTATRSLDAASDARAVVALAQASDALKSTCHRRRRRPGRAARGRSPPGP